MSNIPSRPILASPEVIVRPHQATLHAGGQKAARGRVTLSDSSDTFSVMWRIRSKLRSPASFFSIRSARSATGGLTENRRPRSGGGLASPGRPPCARMRPDWRRRTPPARPLGLGRAESPRGKGFLLALHSWSDRLTTVYADPYRALCPVSRLLMSCVGDVRARTVVTCGKFFEEGRETWCTRLTTGVARGRTGHRDTTEGTWASTKTWR